MLQHVQWQRVHPRLVPRPPISVVQLFQVPSINGIPRMHRDHCPTGARQVFRDRKAHLFAAVTFTAVPTHPRSLRRTLPARSPGPSQPLLRSRPGGRTPCLHRTHASIASSSLIERFSPQHPQVCSRLSTPATPTLALSRSKFMRWMVQTTPPHVKPIPQKKKIIVYGPYSERNSPTSTNVPAHPPKAIQRDARPLPGPSGSTAVMLKRRESKGSAIFLRTFPPSPYPCKGGPHPFPLFPLSLTILFLFSLLLRKRLYRGNVLYGFSVPFDGL